MKLVVLNGTSTVGKSSVVQEVLKKKEKYFRLTYDGIKRFFSQYDRESHWHDVGEVQLAVARRVIELGYNIILDGSLYKEKRSQLINFAKSADYEIVEINLEADYDVLEIRFDERIKNSVNAVVKPTNISKERFKELHDIYHREKNPGAITIRTDELSLEDTVAEVLKYC